MQFHLFLPQMRMTHDGIVDRALAAESAGFDGIAFMDHLAPPMADDQPRWEAVARGGATESHTGSFTSKGGTLLGLLGALIAVPVTATLLMILKEVFIPRQDAKVVPD